MHAERVAHAVPTHGVRQQGGEDTGASTRMKLRNSKKFSAWLRITAGAAAAGLIWWWSLTMANSLAAEKTGKDPMQLTSTAFTEGAAIPARYTCDARNTSPPLKWSGIPASARSLALIVDDPDAPVGTWVHWVLYDLPAATSELAEDVPKSQILRRRRETGPKRFPAPRVWRSLSAPRQAPSLLLQAVCPGRAARFEARLDEAGPRARDGKAHPRPRPIDGHVPAEMRKVAPCHLRLRGHQLLELGVTAAARRTVPLSERWQAGRALWDPA